jgi:hypothetical protein
MHTLSGIEKETVFFSPVYSEWLWSETAFVASQFSVLVNVLVISLRPRNGWCKVGNIWNVLSGTWCITGHALTAGRGPTCCILNWHKEKHFDVSHVEVLLQARRQPQFTVLSSYFYFRGSSVVIVTRILCWTIMESGFESRQGQEASLSSTDAIPDLGPTQPM